MNHTNGRRKPHWAVWLSAEHIRQDGACEISLAGKGRGGYPRVRVDGQYRMLGAVALELKLGRPLLPGHAEVMRHTCDNPACIRLDHLIPGTHADNVRDKIERGRQAAGETHGRAKLNAVQVRFIRQYNQRYGASPLYSQGALGKMFGLDRSTIGNIVRKEIWKDA